LGIEGMNTFEQGVEIEDRDGPEQQVDDVGG
jgi:hypothetical protein